MKVVDVPDRSASRNSEKVEMYIFDSAGASIFGILERNTKYVYILFYLKINYSGIMQIW